MTATSPAPLHAALKDVARAVDAALAAHVSGARRPPRLMEAMQRALFAGGKRMRPFLVVESARLFGVEGAAPLEVAAALEAIHCYSLVHDDLPAMDDDDLRRGQPTLHRAYDEATAILAGDGLLTLAFSILSGPTLKTTPARRLKLIAALAKAAGVDGMVGGQMLDLAAEGRFNEGGKRARPTVGSIRRIQSLKTGALIEFALTAGALLAQRATREEKKALLTYGRSLGLAFQIRDDLLDVVGDAATVGKALAKDAAAGKATFVGLLGLEGAQAELASTAQAGKAALEAAFGARSGPLCALMDYNSTRES